MFAQRALSSLPGQGLIGNDMSMRRLWAVAAAVFVVSGCSSDRKTAVPEVTIPVETTVATSIPPATTEATTIPPTSTSTSISATPEEELRTATQAYWAEFRRTALNLESDDLSGLAALFTADASISGVARLTDLKNAGETYRPNTPDIFEFEVERVAISPPAEGVVLVCASDNLVRVRVENGVDRVIDSTLGANRLEFHWVKLDGTWKVESVKKIESLGEGVRCVH